MIARRVVFQLLAVVTLALSLASCGGGNSGDSSTGTGDSTCVLDSSTLDACTLG